MLGRPAAAARRGLGAAAARWRRWRPSLRRPPLQLLYADRAGVRALGAGTDAARPFADWCAANPGARCRLLLSSSMLLTVDADPALGLGARRELEDYARTQLARHHGAAAQSWPACVWRGAAGHAGASVWMAPADAGPDALREAAARHRVRLAGVHPLWAVLAAAAPRPAAGAAPTLLIDEGSATTLVERDADAALVRVQLRRGAADELLRLEGTSGGAALRLAPEPSRALAAQAARAPDLLPPQAPTRVDWLAAGAAFALAALAAVEAVAAWQRLDAAPAPVADASASPSATALAPGAVAGDERDALAWPWGSRFAAAEAATAPGMRWLAADFGAATLRLEAQAPDIATALDAAARLQRRPGVGRAVLTRVAADAGGAVRVELQAELADAPPVVPAGAPR